MILIPSVKLSLSADLQEAVETASRAATETIDRRFSVQQ